MTDLCPKCGAQLREGETCGDLFNLTQFKEAEVPACFQVHHLSVPSYMLQHNVYSKEGWLAARGLLDQFINGGLMPESARRQNRQRMDDGHRLWRLTSGPKLEGVGKIGWTLTVADIRLDTTNNYCGDIRAWAEALLTDTKDLVRSEGH